MIGKKVVCINDANRPADFPTSLWIKRSKTYTVSAFDKIHQMGGELGIQVEEIDLSGNFPYQYFLFSRFVFKDDVEDLIKELEEELNLTY